MTTKNHLAQAQLTFLENLWDIYQWYYLILTWLPSTSKIACSVLSGELPEIYQETIHIDRLLTCYFYSCNVPIFSNSNEAFCEQCELQVKLRLNPHIVSYPQNFGLKMVPFSISIKYSPTNDIEDWILLKPTSNSPVHLLTSYSLDWFNC